MSKLKITGKELRSIGFPEGPVISIAMQVMMSNFKHKDKQEAFKMLKEILLMPEDFINDKVLEKIATTLIQMKTPKPEEGRAVLLNEEGVAFEVFGREHIEEVAMHQMHLASKLPIAVAGALMPDAHLGYGLPIGGVLATKQAVIPYGVGVDIGCRMCLSIFDIAPDILGDKTSFFKKALVESTLFGSGAQFGSAADHAVMENNLFYELPLLKNLHSRVWKQLGSSGSGNHFAEFGTVTLDKKDEVLGVEAGTYLGFLSHSGSRALGANVANHYTKIAIDKLRLQQDAKNLAWLSLDEADGMEYWLAMNLAGDYAAACHQVIHQKIARQLGRSPVKIVENHHNFAWKEMYEGQEVIVHRKGATPAGLNVLGIIPGSMTAPGFIVKGKGNTGSVNSASHGAGRKMSRSAAIKSISDYQMKDELLKQGVELIGGGLDEAPFAYKDIDVVMQSQKNLVDVVGKFLPKIVQMDGGSTKPWMKKK